jgi:hypothetical protein
MMIKINSNILKTAFLTILIGLLMGLGCSKSKKMSKSDIFEILKISDNSQAKLAMNKYINLNNQPDMETFAIILMNDHEKLASFKKSGTKWQLIKDYSFFLPQYGPYKFIDNINDWVPAPSSEKKGIKNKRFSNIISHILINQIKPNKFNSILLSYLGSPIQAKVNSGIGFIEENFWILEMEDNKNLKKKFDFKHFMTGKKKWEGIKKIDFTLIDDGTIVIRGKNPQLGKSEQPEINISSNGIEYYPVYKHQPFIRFYTVKLKKTSSENIYSFTLNGKNKGSFSTKSFITLSVLGGEIVKITDKPSHYQHYPPGSKIFHLGQKKYIKSQNHVLEINKSPWPKNYRITTDFRIKKYSSSAKKEKTAAANGEPKQGGKFAVLLRAAFKSGGESLYLPEGMNSNVYVQKDQQGMSAYVITPDD